MKRWWSLFLEAVRGSDRDYTVGPVGPALVMLSVPMVLEMAMESLFAVVDVFYVSRVSADAVATVGVTESMLTIVYTVALGLGIGAMAVVSRRVGEKDEDGAAQAASQAIALGLLVALAVGLFGFFNAERLMRAMGATPSMIESSLGYTQVMFAGNATVTLLFLNNAIFRGAGDPAIAMRMLWLGNAINIVVCPFLIFGIGPFPEMGVTGAAVGTNIGRGTAVLTQLWMLWSGRSRIHIRRRHLTLIPAVMWNVCRLSGSGFIQILIDTSSYIGLVRIISTFGSDALAGYTIGIRTVIFAILPAWGLANAAATMVGQALGAKKPDRAEQAVWTAGKYNAIVLGVVSVFFIVFAPWIVSIYTTDPGVAPYATACLRIVSTGFVFFAYGLVFTQSFNGAGDTWTPTWINLGCFWAWQIPLAWFLAIRLEMGPIGVFIAMTVAFSTLAVVSGVIFRRGWWKTGGLNRVMIHVVGGGLAGSEAAWQAAELGVDVTIHEMRPVRPTAVHKTDALAELVCSNSFRADKIDNAVGLIKEEMRRLGSLVMRAADEARVPAGAALAVDRHVFAQAVTRAVEAHPRIRISREEVLAVPGPEWSPVIIATGPLTSDALSKSIQDDGRRGAPGVLRRDQPDRARRIDRHVEGVPRLAMGPERLERRRPGRRSINRTKATT